MLTIFNTQGKQNEVFKPINEKEVTMYVCGPTVYSNIHIGNARPVIFFDMVKEYLEFLNYNVKYVSNITDIDDKIIDEAAMLNIKEVELTNKYTEAFIEATKYVGSKLPNEMPKATNYINEMITYINELIEKDFAYVTESGVYFKISNLPSYGSISGQILSELESSVRIENKSDKKDFKDFTLWKTTTEGLAYESPWGVGRPGWHTECAVMNNEIFRGTIDIHGGGSDLIFPHHENENAQTIAHSDHELANYWMHVGRIDFQNVKMSKSLGNTILVKDLEDPISYRLLVLAHHYRNQINFTEELLNEFISMYDKIVRTIKRALLKIGTINTVDLDLELINNFKYNMDNDFNTPNVITLILDIIKNLNKETDTTRLTLMYNTLITILDVLGLNPKIALTKDIQALFSAWEIARLEKDYAKADQYRNELLEMGWI